VYSTFVAPSLTPILFWVSFALILYAYWGYPVLIFILAKLFPHAIRSSSNSDTPGVTLLIAA